MLPVIEYIGSPNMSPRKRGAKITALIIHYTGSLNIEGTIAWFKKSESQVSAHYVIGREGRIISMVREDLKAWHAGISAMRPDLLSTNPLHERDVNQFSIGIELVGTHDSGFTDKQLATLYSLTEILVDRYNIAPERILGHRDISPTRKIDPDGYDNQFNWDKIRSVARSVYR